MRCGRRQVGAPKVSDARERCAERGEQEGQSVRTESIAEAVGEFGVCP